MVVDEIKMLAVRKEAMNLARARQSALRVLPQVLRDLKECARRGDKWVWIGDGRDSDRRALHDELKKQGFACSLRQHHCLFLVHFMDFDYRPSYDEGGRIYPWGQDVYYL